MKLLSISVTAQAFKGHVIHNYVHLASKSCPDATVCQLSRNCHCTATGTDEVNETAVR